MPELPEVEVTRLSFVRQIAGAKVLGVHMGKPLRWPLGCEAAELVGRLVLTVRRRGKYLLLELDRGLLLLHLGMSGSLVFARHLAAPGVHDHFDMVTSHGTLRLHDPRRFGAVVYAPGEDSAQAIKLLGRLGMEPLDEAVAEGNSGALTIGFDVKAFHTGLKSRKTAIKQVLLAGDVVVGVGNIYASEALFLAGIRPTLRASALSRPRTARLHAAIRQVEAVASLYPNDTMTGASDSHFL